MAFKKNKKPKLKSTSVVSSGNILTTLADDENVSAQAKSQPATSAIVQVQQTFVVASGQQFVMMTINTGQNPLV